MLVVSSDYSFIGEQNDHGLVTSETTDRRRRCDSFLMGRYMLVVILKPGFHYPS